MRITKVHSELEQSAKEHFDKQESWRVKRKKAFVTFIKSVLEQDKRYTLVPFVDQSKEVRWSNSFASEDSSNILGTVMLKREGTYTDVVIQPNEPKYGVRVFAGSKMNHGGIQAYPSPSLAWPIISMANELERQFTREVEWEMTKHGQQTKVNKKRGSHV
jgi:hypothetical protein